MQIEKQRPRRDKSPPARLERLREAVRNGTYRVPATQLSRRLVARYPR